MTVRQGANLVPVAVNEQFLVGGVTKSLVLPAQNFVQVDGDGIVLTVAGSPEETAEAVRDASGGGVDYAIEATGRPEAMLAAFLSTRARGASPTRRSATSRRSKRC